MKVEETVAAPAPAEDAAHPGAVVRRVVRSGVWTTVGYVVSSAAAFFVAVAAGRALGPEGFGRFSFYLWATRLAVTVLAVGTPALLTRFVSEYLGRSDLGRARGVLRLTLRSSAVTGPAAAAAVATFVLWRGESAFVAAALAASAVLGLLGVQLEGFLSGVRRFRTLARVALVSGIVQIALVVVALALHLGWRGYLSLQALTALAPVAVAWTASRRVTRGWSPAPLGRIELGRAARFAGIMAVITLATEIVYGRPELFFLERYRGDAAVGLYSAALRLSALMVVLPALATRVLLPEFSWLGGKGRDEEMKAAFRTISRYIAVIGVPLAIGGAAVADMLVRTVYGGSFAAAAPAAAILIGGSLAGGILGVVSAAVFAGPRARFVAQVAGGIVALNLVLDVVLISRFGIAGAAVANTASQVIGACIGLAFAMRRLGLPYPGADVAKLIGYGLVTAAAARIAAAALSGPAALAVAVAAGAVVYTLLVLGTRIVRPGEIAAIFRRSPGAPAVGADILSPGAEITAPSPMPEPEPEPEP